MPQVYKGKELCEKVAGSRIIASPFSPVSFYFRLKTLSLTSILSAYCRLIPKETPSITGKAVEVHMEKDFSHCAL